MKYAPKKVFILENGLYKEITYSELKQLEQADKSYMDKFFLPLYGMLMRLRKKHIRNITEINVGKNT